jgi:hypothetical protein
MNIMYILFLMLLDIRQGDKNCEVQSLLVSSLLLIFSYMQCIFVGVVLKHLICVMFQKDLLVSSV